MTSAPTEAAVKAGGFTYRKTAWALMLLLLAVAAAMVLIPVRLIMPFDSQTPQALETAYVLRNWSPIVTVVALLAAVAATVLLWRGSKWWKKTAMVLCVALAGLFAWFARQNHFEWMFNPLLNPEYVRVADASFVDDKDKVLAVEIGGEAVAYPVRQLAYHHIVQDTVGGTPIAVTY